MALKLDSSAPTGMAIPSLGAFKLTREHLWLGLPVFVLLWKNFLFSIPVLDFWWHLKAGEVIAATRSIPRIDQFSCTAAGKQFIVQNWLADLSYYGMYRLRGLSLIAFVNTLIVLAAFLAIYSLCRRATGSLRTAVPVATLAAFAFLGTIRPQTFSFLMFALYYFILAGYRSRRVNRLWMLPILMVLWVNLHGAFPLGLVIIALFIAGEGCRRFVAGTDTAALTWPELRRLAFVLVLCLLATLANPEGYKVYDYVRTVMADSPSQRLVAEWQPPRINEISGIVLFYVPFFLTLIAFIYTALKPDLTEIILFLGFGVLGLTALRNGAWFSMVTYPMLARYLPALDLNRLQPLRRFEFVNWMVSWFENPKADRPAHSRMNLLVAFLAVLVLVVQSPWVQRSVYNASLIQEGTPVGAVDFIRQHRLEGNIFHPQIFGDYLIWRAWPEQKSFFDGRVHIFGEDFVRKYSLVFHDSHWEELLAGWQIRYLLLSKSPGEKDSRDMIRTARDSGRWKTLYEDDIAILLEKDAVR